MSLAREQYSLLLKLTVCRPDPANSVACFSSMRHKSSGAPSIAHFAIGVPLSLLNGGGWVGSQRLPSHNSFAVACSSSTSTNRAARTKPSFRPKLAHGIIVSSAWRNPLLYLHRSPTHTAHLPSCRTFQNLRTKLRRETGGILSRSAPAWDESLTKSKAIFI